MQDVIGLEPSRYTFAYNSWTTVYEAHKQPTFLLRSLSNSPTILRRITR